MKYTVTNQSGIPRAEFHDKSEALLFMGAMGNGYQLIGRGRVLFIVGYDEPHPAESVDGAWETAERHAQASASEWAERQTAIYHRSQR